jgi:FemAB-related protein (PEP-CTERM system-associated)
MTDIIEYDDSRRAEWDDYVRRSKAATIAHEIGWRSVMAGSLGHRPRYLMALRDGVVVGILPLFVATTWWRARYVVSLPWIDYGGICADDSEAARLLLERAIHITKEEGAEFLELRSPEATDCDLADRTDKVTFQLPLQADPEVLWKGFDAKLRNQIRKSQKSQLTAAIGGSEHIEDFYRIFTHNMRDLGTPVWGRDFFEAILEEFPDTAGIILVRLENKPVAGGLVLSFKGTRYVPSASAYRSYIKLCPNHALYWHCIKTACEEGYRYFDFGRSTWNSNTFKFKKQWMPEPRQLTWQYYLNRIKEVPKLNPSNPKYRLFIGMWRKLPLWAANFLGPRVIRNFP